MEKKKERRETSHMLLGLEFAFFFHECLEGKNERENVVHES